MGHQMTKKPEYGYWVLIRTSTNDCVVWRARKGMQKKKMSHSRGGVKVWERGELGDKD